MAFGDRSPSLKRTGSVMSVLFLVLMIFVSALPVSAARSRPRRQQPRTGESKSRKSKSQNLSKITARRGSPVAREAGDRESSERSGRRGKRAARSEGADQPAEAVQAELEKRLPKGATQLPIERYFEAKEQMKNMQRYSTAEGALLPAENETGESDQAVLARTNGASLSAGSTSGVLGTWQSLGPGNVGGRTRAIIIDPVTPDPMYAAGGAGGLLKTTNAGGIWKPTNAGASWSPLDDFMANIAVTALVFEPGNSSVIYAATGEGFFNADAVRGAGIFKSTDAGGTWTRLASTNTVDFQFVNDVVVSNVNAQHIYAATRTGVWRSLDGGAN